MLLYWILLPIVWVLAHIIWRFEVIGRENLKTVRDGRAYVIAPNHIANLDPVFIAITVFDWKRLRILAKEELFKNPLAGWFLRCMGAVAIERGRGDTTTVEQLTNECKNGTGIMIFPEGTRTKTGKLGMIKSGALSLPPQPARTCCLCASSTAARMAGCTFSAKSVLCSAPPSRLRSCRSRTRATRWPSCAA